MGYRWIVENAGTWLSDEDAAAAERLLRDALYLHLAMMEPSGPYLVPVNFAYVDAPEAGSPGGQGPAGETSAGATPVGRVLGGRIYLHTGEGRKTRALAADPRVCLAVTAAGAFEQGALPCADGFSYRSLLIWGEAVRIEEQAGREMALRWIVAKYDPDAVEVPFSPDDLARTLVYEVTIGAATYKQQPPPASR